MRKKVKTGGQPGKNIKGLAGKEEDEGGARPTGP